MIRRFVRPLLIGLLATGFNTQIARADFAAGAQSYDSGDFKSAFSEWQAAARAGDLAAMIALADLYQRGPGGKSDIAKAFHWYKRAALKGNAIAQMNLGEMYLKGWGTRRDRILAWVWFDKAAQQGRNWAKEQRSTLENSLSPTELAKAMKMRRIKR